MGIVRTIEWALTCSPEEADLRIRNAFQKLDITPEGPPGHIRGAAKRAMMKNRWAMDINADVSPVGAGGGGGCTVVCRLDMLGNKHYEVASELADAVGEEVFDDHGLSEAVERLGKFSRLFGRKEVRHLRNVLHARERVIELGQGQYVGKMALVVLTSERMFFLEKSLGSESIEEFSLASISSVGISKKMVGETLLVHVSGNNAEIKNMMHGQGDAMARAVRNLKAQPSSAVPTPAANASDDAISQLQRLAALRDEGILTAEEFETKKADLITRI